MNGQGCPKNRPIKTPAHRRCVVGFARALFLFGAALFFTLAASTAFAQHVQGDAPYRFRISWGGGQNQAWQGSLFTKNGKLSNIAPLGLNRDSSVTALLTSTNNITITQRSPTSYDGFDFSIFGSDESTIDIDLRAMDGSGAQWQKSIRIAELLDDGLNEALDEMGHGISIARVPGDSIQVDFKRDHLVFSPGEPISVAVAGKRMSLRSSQSSCRLTVVKARQSDPPLWTTNQPLEIDADGNSATSVFQLNAPEDEGVYDLVIQMEKNWFSGSITASNKAVRPLAGKKSLVVRRVQFVVLNGKKSVRPTPDPTAAPVTNQLIETLTPEQLLAEPTRWSIAKNEPRLLTADPATIVRDGGQSWLQLQPGQWHAIALKIADPGRGHTIEIDYDDSGPIAAGLSVLDFDANGQVPINGADSGIFVPESLVHQLENQEADNLSTPQSTVGKHSLKFWPRSNTCYLLVANQSEKHAARLASIRVLAQPKQADPKPELQRGQHENLLGRKRQRLAFYTSANFAEGLNVEKFFDARVNQPLDDWDVFYQGALRLVDYLKESNYQGAIIPVVIDGATLYPSQLFRGSPKSDSGTFQSMGQDPFRKDVLRMLLTIFERENLTLIPAFEFSGPTTRIEMQRGGAENDIDILDSSAELSNEGFDDFPRYNPLSPIVQQHAIDVIAEAVQRYSGFSSMGGVSLMCRPNSWTMLPGRRYGYDRKTIGRFLTSLPQPPESSEPAQGDQNLIHHVLGDFREQWVQWRSDQMSDFYLRLSTVIKTGLPEGRLLIAPINLHKNAEVASALSPNLHSSVDVAPLLQRLGLDPGRLEESESIVLLNPQPLPSTTSLPDARIGRQTNELASFHSFFQSAKRETGTLFYQDGTWAHFAQLQNLSPFDNQVGRLIRRQQLTPAGTFSRQPMARALHRLDSSLLIDASNSLSMGPSNNTDNFTRVFSMLPREKFSEVPLRTDHSTDSANTGNSVARANCPIAVRTLETAGSTFLYCVNDSPWPTQVNIHLGVSTQEPKMHLTSSDNGRIPQAEQGPERTFQPFTADMPWNSLPERGGDRGISIELPPYEVWGGTFKSNAVEVSHFDIELPKSGEKIHGVLRKKIYQLQAKLNLATSADSVDVLLNQSFESEGRGSLDGWEWDDQSNEQISLEQDEGYESIASLRMKTGGESVWMRSNRFAPPKTGRLSVTVWIKSVIAEQPPLRLAIEGQTRSSTYYRFGAIGALAPDSGVNQIDNQWRRFAVHFDDLPAEELIDLRVGFDLMGAGEVLIDNVRVYDRWLDDKDTTAMTQLLASAVELLSRPDGFESCRRIVEGHWARFLDEYTQPLPEAAKFENESSLDQHPVEQKFSNEVFQDGGVPSPQNDILNEQPSNSSRRTRDNSKPGTSLLRRWRNSLKRRK